MISAPPPTNNGRGATIAISSWLSTDISLALWPGAREFQEIAGEPVEFVDRRQIGNALAEVAAIERGAARARGANEPGGETLVIGERDQGRLAPARMAEDRDLLRGSTSLVGGEIVQAPARRPSPRRGARPNPPGCAAGPC